jgi:GDP-mannose 6-dehydrogenase
LGLSFKSNTDDLRESPVIALIQALWRDGVDITVYDPDIQLDEMIGSNREYTERQLPQIKKILKHSAEEALRHAQAIVITQKRPEFREIVTHTNLPILDMVRLDQNMASDPNRRYLGLSW